MEKSRYMLKNKLFNKKGWCSMIMKSLKDAIEQRKTIRLIYKGTERIVEPHLLGISTTRKETLSGYQTGGYSSSGSLPDWRQFIIKDIDSVEILDEAFNIRPGYNPNDSKMIEILFRV